MTAILLLAACAAFVLGAGAWLKWALIPVVIAFHAGRLTGRRDREQLIRALAATRKQPPAS